MTLGYQTEANISRILALITMVELNGEVLGSEIQKYKYIRIGNFNEDNQTPNELLTRDVLKIPRNKSICQDSQLCLKSLKI